MADENRAKIMEQIKQQGDVVRKLKAEKAEKSQVCISVFITLRSLMDILLDRLLE